MFYLALRLQNYTISNDFSALSPKKGAIRRISFPPTRFLAIASKACHCRSLLSSSKLPNVCLRRLISAAKLQSSRKKHAKCRPFAYLCADFYAFRRPRAPIYKVWRVVPHPQFRLSKRQPSIGARQTMNLLKQDEEGRAVYCAWSATTYSYFAQRPAHRL